MGFDSSVLRQTESFIMDIISEIKQAKGKLAVAKEIKCVCSGFYLQYEGQCDCERGKKIRSAEFELDHIIEKV